MHEIAAAIEGVRHGAPEQGRPVPEQPPRHPSAGAEVRSHGSDDDVLDVPSGTELERGPIDDLALVGLLSHGRAAGQREEPEPGGHPSPLGARGRRRRHRHHARRCAGTGTGDIGARLVDRRMTGGDGWMGHITAASRRDRGSMPRDTNDGATIGSVVMVHTSAAGDGSLAPAIIPDAGDTDDAADAARLRAGKRTGDGKSGERWRVQLVVGLFGVAAVLVEGAHVAHRPVAGALDRWLQGVIPGSHAAAYVEVTKLRYPWVVVVVAVLLAAVSLRRDWPRSVACLVGPPLAVFVGEEFIKPLVGRTLGGALSYPSGSTTGAAALATAAILAVPPRWKRVTVFLAGGYALWMAVAVVALRWHFPTDSLGGAVLGIGVVLMVDAVTHLASGRIVGRRNGRHRGVDASLP